MKRYLALLTTLLFVLGLHPLQAQFGGGSPSGPNISGELLKLFGEHKGFTANLEFQIRQDGRGDPMTLPGKIMFANGQTRFEMDLTQAKGEQIPPEALEQLKQMGMEKMVIISLPKKEISYIIYPGLKAYVAQPTSDPDAQKSGEDFEMEISELGKEEVAGHKCIKNKVTVTAKDGTKHESTVWNATDLKDFPVKIQTIEDGHDVALLFKDVELKKPSSSQFAPSSAYTKYDNMMGMMQEIMMKRMGGGAGMPPGQ